jgi:hypothetical protein
VTLHNATASGFKPLSGLSKPEIAADTGNARKSMGPSV